jgi:hypothetical protein
MIATFLLSMGVLAFGALFPTAAKSSKMNGNYAQAVSIAQHKIDQLRSVGYGRLNFTELNNAGIIDATPTAAPFSFSGVDNLASYFPAYSGTIDVSYVNTPEGTTLAQVTVAVTWTGQGDKATGGNATLVSLIAQE